MTTLRAIADFNPLQWQIAPFGCEDSVIIASGTAGGGKSHFAGNKIHAFNLMFPGATTVVLRKTRESMKSSTIQFMLDVVIGDDPRCTYNKNDHRIMYDNGSMMVFGGMKDYAQREHIRSIGSKGGIDGAWMEEGTAFEESDFNELLARMRGTATETYYRRLIAGKLQARDLKVTETILKEAQDAMRLGDDMEQWADITSQRYKYDIPLHVVMGAVEFVEKHSWRQIIVTTNPGPPKHWIKLRLLDGGEATYFPSSFKDNIHNPATYESDTLEKLTGVLRDRMYLGLWRSAEGIVFESWNEDHNLISPFDIPPSWERVRVIDFGYNHPFVCLWAAMDDDGSLYIYRQIFHTKRLVAQHAADIIRYSAHEEHMITATVCDHDAENRAQLEALMDITTTAAIKNVEAGVQNVIRRLRVSGDGKPRLMIMRGCVVEEDQEMKRFYRPTSTEDQIYQYIWDVNSNQGVKERPLKRDDDGPDCMRYLCNHFDGIDEVNIFALSALYGRDYERQSYR